MEQGLRRYWIEFEFAPNDQPPAGSRLGVGVTAVDRDDALRLVAERVFGGEPFPAVKRVREDVDVSTLDQGHVIPNMEPPHLRGIWFPSGYR